MEQVFVGLEHAGNAAREWRDYAQAQIAAGEQRLAKAMEREQALREEIAALEKAMRVQLEASQRDLAAARQEVSRLQSVIEQMHDHPQVRARRRADAEARLVQVQKELATLQDPQPADVAATKAE